jgi:hypothetical protein
MPLSWKIAPLERMVVCTAEGTVALPDMLAYFRALDEAKAFPFQKIFIATAGVSQLSQGDLAVVANELPRVALDAVPAMPLAPLVSWRLLVRC